MKLRTQARDGRGMVTAELAVTILAALALMIMMCWGIYLLVMQLRCLDTASAVARQAARGDQAAVAKIKRDAPTGASVSINTDPGLVTVTVRLSAKPLAGWLMAVPLRAEARVVPEPTS